MKIFGKILVTIGVLLITGVCLVQRYNQFHEHESDGIRESATLTSLLLGFERVALCRFSKNKIDREQWRCGEVFVFAKDRTREEVIAPFESWWDDLARRQVFTNAHILDWSVAVEQNKLRAKLARSISRVSEAITAAILIIAGLLLWQKRIGGKAIAGAFLTLLSLLMYWNGLGEEVAFDGLKQQQTLTATLLGYRRAILCSYKSNVVDGPQWECLMPVAYLKSADYTDLFTEEIAHRKAGELEYKVQVNYKQRNGWLPAALIAQYVPIQTEVVGGITLMFFGIFIPERRARFTTWIISLCTKLKAWTTRINAWRKQRGIDESRMMALVIGTIGLSIFTGSSFILYQNFADRIHGDGFAERQTLTATLLGYKRVAPCIIAKYHDIDTEGYLCNAAFAFPKNLKRYRVFSYHSHSQEVHGDFRACALLNQQLSPTTLAAISSWRTRLVAMVT